MSAEVPGFLRCQVPDTERGRHSLLAPDQNFSLFDQHYSKSWPGFTEVDFATSDSLQFPCWGNGSPVPEAKAGPLPRGPTSHAAQSRTHLRSIKWVKCRLLPREPLKNEEHKKTIFEGSNGHYDLFNKKNDDPDVAQHGGSRRNSSH